MIRTAFTELVDIEKIRHLLETQYRITGILSAILDTDENILIAVGWQDICTRFHRCHPETLERCRESDSRIKEHLLNFRGEYLDYRCGNGLRDVAVPIIIGGEHLATFFTGQFFYEDEKPDVEYFRNQAREFGFNEDDYLSALNRVPVCTRDQIRNTMDYYSSLVQMMAEMGRKNLELTKEIKERQKAQTALEESRDYLDKIINSISDPIFVKDREHRLVLVNDAECSLIGRPREEVIGRTDYDFFPKEQVDVFWEKDETVFETGQVNTNEEEITDGWGNRRIIATKKSLYVDRDGSKYLVGIIRDITERARSERKASFFRSLIEYTRDPVYVLDPADGFRIVYVNQAACAHFGRPFEEMLTMRIPDWDPVFDMKNVDAIRKQIKQGKAMHFETVHRLASGELVPVEVSVNYLEHEGKELSAGYFRNISERKRVMEALREKDQLLLQQSRLAAMGEMINYIAHQWRQPLNTIGILVQDMKEDHEDGLCSGEYIDRTVGQIMNILQHMSATIDDFRDFFKTGKKEKPFSLNNVTGKTLSFVADALKACMIKVALDAKEELTVTGYPNEYSQVLLNILNNAREALVERRVESPRIEIRLFREDGKTVTAVRDNAGGIPPDIIDRIFDSYFTTREKGTGIGLYMSKMIIEKRMHGRITANNVEDGAEFRIEIFD